MRILFVPDLHHPVTHPGALDFVDSIAQDFQPDLMIFVGDMVDHHAVSRWGKHPNSPGPLDEYELALEGVQKWYEKYPEAVVCIGNHDERPMKMAESMGVPGAYLRKYADVWQTPRWEWVEDYTILPDDEQRRCYVTHGTGRAGIHPAYNLAKEMACSCVMGHVHSVGGIKWLANPYKRWFGLDTGALTDDKLYAFAYAKPCRKKTILGLGLYDTDDSTKTGFIAMPCGDGEKFHRDNYPEHPLLKGRYA